MLKNSSSSRRRLTAFLALGLALPLAAMPGGSIILAIVGIGFLIFIHEWGHFYACKLTGTRTETFSIGFGPRLFGWEKDRDGNRRFTTGARQLDPGDHAMDFRIALIPLGGYVKMAGELPGESTTGASDEFPQKSASARAFIISAGVIMNFFTAIVFYGIAYGAGKPYQPAQIGTVVPGKPAHSAGLQDADLVLEIDGMAIEDRIDLLTEAALMTSGKDIEVVYERNGERKTTQLRGTYDEAEGRMLIGITTPGAKVTLGEGDDALEIGARQPAVVQGLKVMGGDPAFRRIQDLVRLGQTSIEVQAGDRSMVLTPKMPEAEPKETPVRLGIELAETALVASVRGDAAKVLQQGDILVELTRPQGDPIPVSNKRSIVRAGIGGAVTGLVVRREGLPTTLAVSLSDTQQIHDFFDDVGLKFDDKNGPTVRATGKNETGYFVDGVVYRLPGAPALEAGLIGVKRVVRVGEREVKSFADISNAMKGIKAGSTIDLWIDVGGERKLIEVVAAALVPIGEIAIDAKSNVETRETSGVFSALAYGAGRTVREVKNVFRTIAALFGGTLSFQKNIAGPITLVTVSKSMAEDSMLRLVWFLAYISVMLAVLNILPIPVLDGGHLLFILIEKIKGSPLSETTMIRFQQVGLLMLLVLMFFAFKNDIMRL